MRFCRFAPQGEAHLLKPQASKNGSQSGSMKCALTEVQTIVSVTITGAVRSKARWMASHNATCNFWRSVENLAVTPTQDQNVNVWAVSQATARRRVQVKGALHLRDGGWSSGGFIADSRIDGEVNSGSQQQWLSRNAESDLGLTRAQFPGVKCFMTM